MSNFKFYFQLSCWRLLVPVVPAGHDVEVELARDEDQAGEEEHHGQPQPRVQGSHASAQNPDKYQDRSH